MLLYACPVLSLAQTAGITEGDLKGHQEAASQIDQCLTDADARIALLAEQLRDLRSQRDRLAVLEAQVAQGKQTDEAERSSLMHQLSETERTQEAYRLETERLREELRREAALKGTLEDALSKATRQKSEFEGLLSDANRWELELSEWKDTAKQAERDRDAYRVETERLRREMTRLVQSNDVADEALRVVTRQKSDLQERLVQAGQTQEQALAELKLGQDEALNKLEAERTELIALRKAKELSDVRANDAEGRITDLQERLSEAEAAANELGLMRSRHTTTARELEQLTQELDELRKKTESRANQRLALANLRDDLRTRLAKAEEEARKAKTDKEAVDTKLAASSKQVSDLEKALAEARKGDAERERLAKLRDDLQGRLAKVEEEAGKAKEVADAQLAASSKQVSDLEEALAEARKGAGEGEEAARALAVARESLSRAEQERDAAKKSMDDAKLVWQSDRQKIEEALKKAQDQLANAGQSRDEQAQEVAALKAEHASALKNLEDTLSKAQADQKAQTADQAEREQRLKDLEAAAVFSKKQLADAQKAVAAEQEKAKRAAELEQELAQMKQRAEQEKLALAKLSEEAKAAEVRIGNLTLAQTNKEKEAADALKALQDQLANSNQKLDQAQKGWQDKEKAWEQTRVTYQSETERLKAELAAARQVQQAMQGDFLRIDPIRYALNSAQIDDEQARVLGQVQKILKVYPTASFEISGHTCTLGSEARNLTLSQQRAQRLLDFLSENGVAQTQLSSAGFGETKPIADNSTDAGRRQNRRVEIRVRSADGKVLLDTESQTQ